VTPATLVVLAVVPRDGRYLLVEERDGTFYLPAGRVEPGESLIEAAIRETEEEAGVTIALRGLLGFDHEWRPGPPPHMRLRFAFVGHATSPRAPKTRPDEHSRGAYWIARDEIPALPLRHPEVLGWIKSYERGSPLLPLSAYAWG
jgi:phosphatase NudJ